MVSELDSGLIYLFIVVVWSGACLGLGWAGCELWDRIRNRARLRTSHELSDEELAEVARILDGGGTHAVDS